MYEITNNDGELIKIFFYIGIVILTLLIVPHTCTMIPEKAKQALKDNGYTDVELTGYKYFKCGSDPFNTTFTGKSITGHKVTGAVCGGFAKGTTIRILSTK